MIVDTVRDFIEKEIYPHEAEVERSGEVPRELGLEIRDETLHSIEKIGDLLNDTDLQGEDLVVTGERRNEAVGIIEAPRGTLIHHYKVDDNDAVTMCNLIVSTTNNNEALNRSVTAVAKEYISGQGYIYSLYLCKIQKDQQPENPVLLEESTCSSYPGGSEMFGLQQIEFRLDAPNRIFFVTSLDKQQRRDVHSVIRRCFPGLISNTKAKDDGTRAMDVFLQSAAKSLKDKKAIGAARWPEGKHKFLQ